ncbi:MAG: hypothetical protein JSS83_14815 [Cyanobacteria bacterium SZAS LIN-3]|nr:hypothetical protein [Cyanobacteria bacterium SZAS LIN-3]
MSSFSPSPTSTTVQRTTAYFALIKAANTITYTWLLLLTWRFISHSLDWKLSTGCVVVSGAWLVMTRIRVDHLLQTYFDVLSRIEIQVPVVIGMILSVVAIFCTDYRPFFRVAAAGEIAFWIYIYALYRRNQSRFKKQGYGPVPRNTWINPPAEVLRAGDLILTSGNIARELHESVGHAEMVIEMPDGKKMLFSSYMEKGTKIHPIEEVTEKRQKGHYIALHLKKPWTPEESARATQIAEEMVAANLKWAREENERIFKRIDWLPLPTKYKDVLKEKLKTSGYDWFGTFMGRTTENRWTCIGAALVLYHRMGIRTNPYGTGLLGFGTSILDPILPVRFLADPAFELITTSDTTTAKIETSAGSP